MVVVLDQHLAFAAVHGPRWPETSYLLVPEPSILPGLFIDDTFKQSRITAANKKQSTQCYREHRDVDQGKPPREAGIAIENDKVAHQRRQNDDQRDGNERAEGPTRASNDNWRSVRLLYQRKHSTDLTCTAAEPSIHIPAGIPRTEWLLLPGCSLLLHFSFPSGRHGISEEMHVDESLFIERPERIQGAQWNRKIMRVRCASGITCTGGLIISSIRGCN